MKTKRKRGRPETYPYDRWFTLATRDWRGLLLYRGIDYVQREQPFMQQLRNAASRRGVKTLSVRAVAETKKNGIVEVRIVNAGAILVGIDPGAQGGIAALLPTGELKFVSMPDTEQALWDYLGTLNAGYNGWKALGVIELVSGYVGQDQPGGAAFKFGQSYGSCRMALTAAGIPFEAVRPQDWQKALNETVKVGTRQTAGSRVRWKKRLLAAAEKLFPKYKLTLATADAALLCWYAKERLYRGVGV